MHTSVAAPAATPPMDPLLTKQRQTQACQTTTTADAHPTPYVLPCALKFPHPALRPCRMSYAMQWPPEHADRKRLQPTIAVEQIADQLERQGFGTGWDNGALQVSAASPTGLTPLMMDAFAHPSLDAPGGYRPRTSSLTFRPKAVGVRLGWWWSGMGCWGGRWRAAMLSAAANHSVHSVQQLACATASQHLDGLGRG